MKSMVKHLLATWQKQFSLQFSTLIVITFSFSALAVFFLSLMNINQILNLWGNQFQITAYLEEAMSNEQIDLLKSKISSWEGIKEVKVIGQAEAYRIFETQLKNYSNSLVVDPDILNALPVSLQIQLNAEEGSINLDHLKAMAKEIQKTEGITEISYGEQWLTKFSGAISLAKTISLGLALILISAMIMVIMNAVRASLDARRIEIEVLEIMGASRWMIIKPFLFEGIVGSTLAGIFSVTLSMGVYEFLVTQLKGQIIFAKMAQQISFFSITQSVLFIGICILTGLISSFLCVNSFVKFQKKDSSWSL